MKELLKKLLEIEQIVIKLKEDNAKLKFQNEILKKK
jgi:hypothetical protein